MDTADRRYLHYDPQTDVYFVREPLPSGEFKYTPFVPASARKFSYLVLQDAHKRCAHAGPDFTLANVRDWALERPGKLIKSIISSCLHCQIKKAKRGTNAELSLATDREVLGPFQAIALDHLSIGTRTHALSVLCRLTGYLVLTFCNSLSADDTWEAFRSALYRLPRLPTIFLSDKASVFDVLCERYQRRYKTAIEHRSTPPHSQFENGALERLHSSVISALKTNLSLKETDIQDVESATPLQIQNLLDCVSYTLNSRPIHELYLDLHDCNRTVITPRLLVFGPGILPGVYSENLPEVPVALKSTYVKWRSVFDGYYWKKLKSASARAMSLRSSKFTFAIGETVLYFHPSSSKTAMDFRAGTIEDIRGNQLVLRTGSFTKTVSVHNCCKLIFRTDHPPGPFDVTRIGARIKYTFPPDSGSEYPGTVIQTAPDGLLLVRWDLRSIDGIDTGWPDEWLSPDALVFEQ